MYKNILIALSFVVLLVGCTALTQPEIKQKQETLDAMAKKAIAGLIEKDPKLQKELDSAVGYAVANMKLTKIPFIGAGGGEGVFVNPKSKARHYFNVSRLDIGGGWGVRSYKVLMIIHSKKILKEFENGMLKFEAGAEVSAGTAAVAGGSSSVQKDLTMHVLSDGGASATVTARVIYAKIDKELTYIPNKKLTKEVSPKK